MLSQKLTQLLQTFDRYELNRLRKFLCSPFFNENEDLIRLFDLIDHSFRYAEDGNAPEVERLTKKVVWKKLFPRKKYKDAHLRRLCSELTHLAYEYLNVWGYRSDESRLQSDLLEILNDRKLDKHFTAAARKFRRTEAQSCVRNAGFHYRQYLFNHFLHLNREQAGKKMNDFAELEKADHHLDCFYFSRKLKHYCDALDYRNTLSAKADISLLPCLLDYLEAENYLQEPAIQVYYLVAKMLLDPKAECYFFQLKSLLKTEAGRFEKEDLNTLYIYLKNYCIDTKINNGQSAYFHELFDIFKTLLEQEIIIHKGRLDPQDYKNIITVGLHIQEFEWVEHFIQQYTAMLPEEHQENALNYNLAKVYFHQKRHERVIEQLREVGYKNLIYALGGKLMLLKTYYELQEFLALDSLTDSFRIYLRRNRMISRDVKRQYLNVIRFVKKLSRVDPRDKNALEKIRKEVESCDTLAAKKWILEKMSELVDE